MKTEIRTATHGKPLTIESSDNKGWVWLDKEHSIEVLAIELFHAIKSHVELNKAKS